MSAGESPVLAPELAITQEDFGPPASPPVPEPAAIPYNPEKIRENYRGIIAMILISLMAALIAASFTLFWLHPDRSKDLEHFFSLIFGPVVALVGAATGYYFGSQSANKT